MRDPPKYNLNQNIFKGTEEQFAYPPEKRDTTVSQTLIAARLTWLSDQSYQVTTVNLDDGLLAPLTGEKSTATHSDL